MIMNTFGNNDQAENETRHEQVTGFEKKYLHHVTDIDNNNTNSPTDQPIGDVPQLPEEACLPEVLGSGACDWLDCYVDFSRFWSPLSYDGYHEACGLFVLSTVAAGRVVFDLSGQRKTNLNILLVGRTSIHAKSTASNIAKELLVEAGLDWLLLPDDITPQKLIAEMSSNELPENFSGLNDEEQQKEINRVLTAGQRGWNVDEFGDNIAAMMRPDGTMTGIKGLIRTMDGSPSKYEYSTISRGKNTIMKPYLPILGNVTIADLSPYAKKGNTLWGDGFFARFATPTPPNDTLSFGRFPNQHRIFPDSLISPLVHWNVSLGFPEYEIIEINDKQLLTYEPLTPKHLKISDEVFNNYYDYHDALRCLILGNQNHDLDGNYARFPEKALRIAALFASLGQCEFIEPKHWAKAQAITERWRYGLHHLYQQVTDPTESQTAMFVKDLPIEDQITRALAKKIKLDKRGICQFTGLTNDIVEPAIVKLESEKKIVQVGDNGTVSFMLTN